MNTTPNREILPERFDENLKKILDEYSRTISEAIYFGTHILAWDVQKEREGKDNYIPTLFFRNILDLGDSICNLIQNSSIDSSKILLRSLLENSFSLIYLLEKNERERSLSYIIWKTLKDLKKLNRFIVENPSSKELKKLLTENEFELDFENLFNQKDIQNHIDIKLSLLQKPEFIEVYEEYIRTKGKRKNPAWYSLYDGPPNFQELAKSLKKSLIYEFEYRNYSENVHVTGVHKGITKTGEDLGQIIQIRDFEDCTDVFQSTIMHLIDSYKIFVEKRIPHKLDDYNKWYYNFKLLYQNVIQNNKLNYRK